MTTIETTPQPAAPSQLEEKLCNVQVGVRADLETSRHQFRGEVKYIILDPITFQTHGLQQLEYELLARIQESLPLGEVFDAVVDDELLAPDQKEEFYEFVLRLHQIGFLSLPIVNEQALYRRFEQKRKRSQRELLLAFISYRVPLFDPNQFLDRTIRFARPLFSRWFFMIWSVLVACALGCVIGQADEFLRALPSLVETQNLLTMWFVLVGLKVLHEFGHAYACKHFGGKVPEMGAFFILMTPCAYVNATASWGFSSKQHRVIVGLAGMYFESMIAAAAALVWLLTGPSFAHSIAFQTMVIASVTTIGFNVNPLMRFDGYYVFSDLVEIPNLRSRATAFVNERFSHLLLGIKKAPTDTPRGVRVVLLVFGSCAMIYRYFLLFSISLLLIMKFSIIGIAMAGIYVGIQVVQFLGRVISFFRCGEHSTTTRIRAWLMCAMLAVGLPLVLLGIPLPQSMTIEGNIEPESYHVVSATVPGIVRHINVEPGNIVITGDLLVELENPESESALLEAQAMHDLANLQHQLAMVNRANDASSILEEITFQSKVVAARHDDVRHLRVEATQKGLILDCVRPENAGGLVKPGDAIALIGSGRTVATLHLTEHETTLIDPKPGDVIEYRLALDPAIIRHGTILKVGKAASQKINAAIEYAIEVDPEDQLNRPPPSDRPNFELTLLLEDINERDLKVYTGGTVFVRMQAQNESVGRRIYRRVLLFVNRLRSS